MVSLAMSVLGRVAGLPLPAVLPRLGVVRLPRLLHLQLLRDTTCLDIRCPFRIQRRHRLRNTARHGLGRLHELEMKIRGYLTTAEIERHSIGPREAYSEGPGHWRGGTGRGNGRTR